MFNLHFTIFSFVLNIWDNSRGIWRNDANMIEFLQINVEVLLTKQKIMAMTTLLKIKLVGNQVSTLQIHVRRFQNCQSKKIKWSSLNYQRLLRLLVTMGYNHDNLKTLIFVVFLWGTWMISWSLINANVKAL